MVHSQRMVAATWKQYVQAIEERGSWVSRRDMASHFGCHISTATYHLEVAAKNGAITKVAGYIGRQPGWLYGPNGLQLELWDGQAEYEAETEAQRRNEEALLYGAPDMPRQAWDNIYDPAPRWGAE